MISAFGHVGQWTLGIGFKRNSRQNGTKWQGWINFGYRYWSVGWGHNF